MSDTAGRTLLVAAVLCGVCSVFVASSVAVLKPKQVINADLDFKKNVLMSAGLLKPGTDVGATFNEKVESVVIDLETGKIAENIDPKTFDQSKANKEFSQDIPKNIDIAGIKRRSKYQQVFLVKNEGALDQVVLHVYGKGLWSTMKGFLSLDKDAATVRGFNYYSHGETPGLGGEVDNPKWIAQWPGKKVYSEDLKPAIDVIKGLVDPSMNHAENKIDGLSGATLTANGVEYTFNYWLSDHAYAKFLTNVRNGEIQ